MNIDNNTGKMKVYSIPSHVIEMLLFPTIDRVINNISSSYITNELTDEENRIFTSILGEKEPKLIICEVGSRNWISLSEEEKERQIGLVIPVLELHKKNYNFAFFAACYERKLNELCLYTF